MRLTIRTYSTWFQKDDFVEGHGEDGHSNSEDDDDGPEIDENKRELLRIKEVLLRRSDVK